MQLFSCFEPFEIGENVAVKLRSRRNLVFVGLILTWIIAGLAGLVAVQLFYAMMGVFLLYPFITFFLLKLFNCPYCGHNVLFKLGYGSPSIPDCCPKCNSDLNTGYRDGFRY